MELSTLYKKFPAKVLKKRLSAGKLSAELGVACHTSMATAPNMGRAMITQIV